VRKEVDWENMSGGGCGCSWVGSQSSTSGENDYDVSIELDFSSSIYSFERSSLVSVARESIVLTGS